LEKLYYVSSTPTPTGELLLLIVALILVGIFQYLLSFSTAVLAILAGLTGQSYNVLGGQYIPLVIDAVLAALVIGLIIALTLAIRGRA